MVARAAATHPEPPEARWRLFLTVLRRRGRQATIAAMSGALLPYEHAAIAVAPVRVTRRRRV
jgi:hypothetical protein